MTAPRSICVLGSTGSIGTQVLDVVERLGGLGKVHSLAAGRNIGLLAAQVAKFHPKIVVCADERDADKASKLPELDGVKVLCGVEGMCEVARRPGVDVVVVSVQGFVGLGPTIAAARAGKTIGIASKEVLVAAGSVVREAVRSGGATLVPIDSEHSALFQCLAGEPEGSIEALILTASGGPFRSASAAEMSEITPEMALDHPTWKMGRKVTVDSATLMNKGLEIIEAQALFGVSESQVEVVIHPKSIVHSLVRFVDGSVKAQLGLPDMRLPIQYALLYPDRVDTRLPRLDLLECGPLEFFEPDMERFPCLRIAREASRAGGVMPAVMSGADDAAVEAFLDGAIGFSDIARIVEQTMEAMNNTENPNVQTIVEMEGRANAHARLLARSSSAKIRAAGSP